MMYNWAIDRIAISGIDEIFMPPSDYDGFSFVLYDISENRVWCAYGRHRDEVGADPSVNTFIAENAVSSFLRIAGGMFPTLSDAAKSLGYDPAYWWWDMFSANPREPLSARLLDSAVVPWRLALLIPPLASTPELEEVYSEFSLFV